MAEGYELSVTGERANELDSEACEGYRASGQEFVDMGTGWDALVMTAQRGSKL